VAIDQPSRLIRVSLERYAAATSRQRTAIERLVGLPDGAALALQHLLRAELTPSALGRRMQLSTGGTTALIRRLARSGLVSRHPHPADGRSTVLRPASDIPARAEEALAPFLADIDELTRALSPADRARIERFLARAADLAEQHTDRLITEAQASAHDALDVPVPVLWG
jgi:DNA-binding MarR family transcriptional regulator